MRNRFLDALSNIAFGAMATFVRSGFLFVAWPSVAHLFKLPSADYADCFFLCLAAEAIAPRLAKAEDAAAKLKVAEHPDALVAAAMRR